ncbi:MAG TPA: ABC transporter permease [Thermoanaerobaculia bacterium]|nr:ABC transporter permease [Thermoanaerobaculia bacterium]
MLPSALTPSPLAGAGPLLCRAARGLARRPGTTLVAVALLAVGLASTVAMLAVVVAYLIRPLPFPAPGRIHVVLYGDDERARAPRGVDAAAWSHQATGVAAGTAWDLDAFTLIGGTPELVLGAWVDPGFFDVAGVPPALGRRFTADDLRLEGTSLAVISHHLWQRRFGGNREAIGATFSAFMSDRPDEAELFTVIGVMPADFWWPHPYTEVLAPLRAEMAPRMVRLRDGVAAPGVAARLEILARAADSALPEDFRIRLAPLQERYVESLAPLLRGLVLATLFVLLVAGGNTLLLVSVSAARRERELAVHAALGGGWGSAARLLATEAVLLASGAGILGLGLGWLATARLAPFVEPQLGRSAPGGADAIAVGPFELLVLAAAVAGIACLLAAVPALLLRRRDLAGTLRGAAASATSHRAARRLRLVVLGGEIAFTLALLAAGGLAVRSALALEQRELGHVRQGVLAAGVGLRDGSYPSAEEQLGFADRLLERLETMPGVEHAAIAAGGLLGGMRARPVAAEGADGVVEAEAGTRAVSPGYFATLGIGLRSGRAFEPRDRPDAPAVAIVSAELAATLWPGSDPLGERLRLDTGAAAVADRADPEQDAWRTVVGVAEPVRESLLGEPLPEVYVPFAQSPARWITVALRSPLDPDRLASALGAELSELDPTVPLYSVNTIEQRLAEERAPARFLAALLGGFSLFALALGSAGVYGVIAHGVAQRLREIAIRLSLGADRRRILRLFLGETVVLLAAGGVAGILAGSLLVRAVASRLDGIAASHLPTWLAVAALLAAAALIATWLPALRAVNQDPATLLRSE